MKHLLIGLFTAATCLATPVMASTWADTAELIAIVESTGTTVTSAVCDRNVQGYYQINTETDLDRLTICKNNIDNEDPHAVWEVMAHESIHVAQACLGENVFHDEYIPRIFRGLRTEAPHYVRILDQYSSEDRLLEAEAFYSELMTPGDVKEIVRKACGVKPS